MIDHSQAVEAAKRIAVCDGVDRCEHPQCTVVRYVRSLSDPPPAPTGEPATAETCREFVERLHASAWTAGWRGYDKERMAKQVERYTAELLAMFAGGTCDPTFCELQAKECIEHLEHIFHEDEPSPLMQPEEDDIIRDEVLLVCAVLKSKLPGIPSNTAKGE